MIKHKNNKQTSRKQKEETPPAPVVEEDTKEEKAKLVSASHHFQLHLLSETEDISFHAFAGLQVPTSEQLRLAQITQSQDNTMDPQRKAKISQVSTITHPSFNLSNFPLQGDGYHWQV